MEAVMAANLAKRLPSRLNSLRRSSGKILLFTCAVTAALVGDANELSPAKTKQQEKQAPQKQKEAPENQGPAKKDAPVRTQMRNVKFRFADNISVQIKTLSGALTASGDYDIPVMDDKNSFKVHIDVADILIYPDDLANVLNSYVFARPQSPLGGVSISIEKGQLKIKGRLRDKANIPFETIGTLSTTPDGRVRLHGEKIKALHVPVKGLMDAFGIEIDDLIKNGKVPGVSTDENDLILDLQQILPPPHIEGPVTAIRIEGNAIATTLGKGASPKRLSNAPASGNFMAYQGNRMEFGNLTMENTDMILIDLDPADPLDFFLEHYRDQLAAGYTKIRVSFQLRVHIKDYDKLNHQPSAKSKTPST
jgi:hypothetical protein